MRNIHSKTDRAGAGISGAHKGYHTYDPNDIPDINMRNIHSKNDRAGAGISGAHKGSHTFDPNDIPDANMRNIHNKNDRAGAGISGAHKGTHVFDPNDIPDPTNRDMQKSKRAAGGAASNNDKPYTFDYINNIPDLTGRDMYKSGRAGGGVHASGQEAQRSRRDANNMLLNVTKEKIEKGRVPTTSNYEKGPTGEFTQFELKNSIRINRALIPELIPNTNRVMPNSQLHRNSRYFINHRIMSPKEALEGNPFINNMVHKSVTTE
jgi:hypothetical protein